jgi:electron transfer flavoprotein alpha subunit
MIIAWIEMDGNDLSEASRQMLTFARGLAGRDGSEVVALLIGENKAAESAALGRFGVSRIVRAENDALDDYAPAAWARAMAQVVSERQPQMVLAAGTDRGNEVMAHLAGMTGLPLTANTLSVDAGDPSRVTRMRWGSSLLEEAVLAGSPRLLTLALNVVPIEEASDPGEPVEETVAPTIPEADLRVRLSRREAEVTEGITLKNAPVVVGGGRGVGSPEGYAVLEKLAELVGGAVGCSRVATNNGWRPHSDQVGLTGTRISPDLYIACGISGAIQHLVGCKGAKRILVINKDPEAAFFSKADFGVLGDLHEVVPAIIEEVKKQTA